MFRTLETECGATPGDFSLHSLQEPSFFRTQILPQALKRRVTKALKAYAYDVERRFDKQSLETGEFMQKIFGMISYMNAQDLSKELREFWKRMFVLDELRSEDTLAVLPELRSAFTFTQRLRRQLRVLRKHLA